MNFRFDPKAGLILVKTKLYGPHGDTVVNLALDTGATWTLVSWETAVLVGCDPASIQQRTAITTKLNLRSVEALGKAVKNLEILCHTLPPTSRVDGLLGLNFLRRFNVRLNFKEGYITVR